MQRIMILLAVAIFALMPAAAQAQVIYLQPQPYVVVPSYYYAPSVTTYSSPATYSYYPPATTVYSAPTTVYAAPAPTYYTYSAPAPTYYTYSAPAVVTYSAPAGVITTRSYYGYGIFRPRGYYSESYYTPLR